MTRRELDVSALPNVVFGHRSLIWWGTLGFMAIEATAFAIIVCAYFYLRTRVTDWPPGVMPPVLVAPSLEHGSGDQQGIRPPLPSVAEPKVAPRSAAPGTVWALWTMVPLLTKVMTAPSSAVDPL